MVILHLKFMKLSYIHFPRYYFAEKNNCISIKKVKNKTKNLIVGTKVVRI